MTTFIEYREGKTYDTAHLRPFDLELAPLAIKDGRALHVGDEVTK